MSEQDGQDIPIISRIDSSEKKPGKIGHLVEKTVRKVEEEMAAQGRPSRLQIEALERQRQEIERIKNPRLIKVVWRRLTK